MIFSKLNYRIYVFLLCHRLEQKCLDPNSFMFIYNKQTKEICFKKLNHKYQNCNIHCPIEGGIQFGNDLVVTISADKCICTQLLTSSKYMYHNLGPSQIDPQETAFKCLQLYLYMSN